MKSKKNLQDKVIKIDGKKFTVKNHGVNKSTGEERLLLVRQTDRVVKEVKTIFDLGYSDEHDIKYTDKSIKDVYELIDTNDGTEVDIAVVATDGDIDIKRITLIGLSLENPSNYKIKMLEDDQGHIVKINLNFLAKSILLAVEFEKAVAKTSGQESMESEESDESEEYSENRPDQDEIFEQLDRLIKSVLHEKRSPIKENTSMPDIQDIEDILSKIMV